MQRLGLRSSLVTAGSKNAAGRSLRRWEVVGGGRRAFLFGEVKGRFSTVLFEVKAGENDHRFAAYFSAHVQVQENPDNIQ